MLEDLPAPPDDAVALTNANDARIVFLNLKGATLTKGPERIIAMLGASGQDLEKTTEMKPQQFVAVT